MNPLAREKIQLEKAARQQQADHERWPDEVAAPLAILERLKEMKRVEATEKEIREARQLEDRVKCYKEHLARREAMRKRMKGAPPSSPLIQLAKSELEN